MKKEIVLLAGVFVMIFYALGYTLDQISDGVNIKYYPSGKLYSEVNYKNGKREGISKEYYDNEGLFRKRNYQDDKLDGIETVYYVDGNLMQEVNYKNGKIEGVYKRYDKNGNLKDEVKGQGEKATVIFGMSPEGDIWAKFASFHPNLFPRSGWTSCKDLTAFPADDIKSRVEEGKELRTYFILDYEVIGEWVPDRLFEGDRGWPLIYIGTVSKAVPFEPDIQDEEEKE